jgi:hypothetical protein
MRTLIVLGALLSSPVAMAQYEPPRMPDGTPDLQGIWTNATRGCRSFAPYSG